MSSQETIDKPVSCIAGRYHVAGWYVVPCLGAAGYYVGRWKGRAEFLDGSGDVHHSFSADFDSKEDAEEAISLYLLKRAG